MDHLYSGRFKSAAASSRLVLLSIKNDNIALFGRGNFYRESSTLAVPGCLQSGHQKIQGFVGVKANFGETFEKSFRSQWLPRAKGDFGLPSSLTDDNFPAIAGYSCLDDLENPKGRIRKTETGHFRYSSSRDCEASLGVKYPLSSLFSEKIFFHRGVARL